MSHRSLSSVKICQLTGENNFSLKCVWWCEVWGFFIFYFCNASGLGREEGLLLGGIRALTTPSPAETTVSTFAVLFSIQVLYTHQLTLFTFLASATINFPLLKKGEQLPDVIDRLFRARIICTKRELWVGVT